MRLRGAAARDATAARRVAPAERGRGPALRGARRRTTVGGLLACLFVGSIAAPVAVPLFSAHAQIWDGYYLLGGRLSAPLEPAFPGSLTPAAPVRFTVFDGFAEVPAYRLTQRLDPLDPRFDPFLRGVAAFFVTDEPSGERRSLSYVRTDLPPAGLLFRLAFRAPAAALTVLDFDVRRRLLAAGMVAAVALAELGVRSVSGRPASGLAMAGMIVPWAVAALNAGGAAVIAAAAVLPALRRLPGPEPTGAAGGTAAVIVVVAVASLLLGGAPAGFAVGAATVGSIAVAGGRWSAGGTPSRGEPRGRRAAAAVSAGTLVALATVVATMGTPPAVRVPAPDAGSAASLRDGITWDALSGLGVSAGGPADLPNAADYVAHVAFQEGLPYGRAYRLPAEGERLAVSSFRVVDRGRLLRDERVISVYDRSWLQRTVSEAGGVGRLLLDAGAVTVRRQRLADAARTYRHAAALTLALALAAGGISVGAALWAHPARARRP